jgi:hypothetical protein
MSGNVAAMIASEATTPPVRAESSFPVTSMRANLTLPHPIT